MNRMGLVGLGSSRKPEEIISNVRTLGNNKVVQRIGMG